MADTQDDTASLKPFYTARLAEDLERNTQEQERLSSEVATLQEKLETLRHDQAILVNMQQALNDAEAAGKAVSPVDSKASVPQQAGGAAQADKAQAARSKKSTAAKSGNAPTLRDLVVSHLSQAGEPRSALEVTDALADTHRGRNFKITVVRSTLEAMVAKGQVRRSKQGKAVFYTAAATSAAGKK
ncbi:hypothetical protein ACH41H_50110 [Streptomyces sp. NPDC020800]|uniref:hypothetical protein n=1 Tax=Streptomyces sp. NPDC020800 TaxID=3365092 RepID=UPI00378FF4C9